MGNVTQLRHRTTAPQLDAHNLAAGYLFQARWESRERALRHCLKHLVDDHGMTFEAAELAALQAYADLESANQRARIDVDATTSHLVVLRTAEGHPVAFTASDLVRLLEQARGAGRAVVVDPERRRPIVLEH